MKNKKCYLVGAIVLILLFSTSSSFALISSNEINRGPELEITTDKTVYEIGEMVTIFFTNIGDETLSGGGPIVTIYNDEEEIVYQEACYCWWEIEPGEYEEWLPWDQTNQQGVQVPVGEYTVEGLLSGNEENYVDTASFYILDYEPSGPTGGEVGESYEYCITMPDEPDCGFYIIWDFGDGTTTEWMGPYEPGEEVCIEHIWDLPGVYHIRVRIRDCWGNEYWSDTLTVTITKSGAPSNPIITGPSKVRVGILHEWTVVSTDPEGSDITYYWDWGDKCGASWYGPYPSGEVVVLPHIYTDVSTYIINAMAMDDESTESDWVYFDVEAVRSRAINHPFLRFLESYPVLLRLLYKIFGL